MFSFPEISSELYITAAPVLILVVGSMIALLQSVSKSLGSRGAVESTAWITVLAAMAATTMIPTAPTEYLAGGLLSGTLSRFGEVMIMAVAVGVMMMMREHHSGASFFRGEIVSLFLMLLSGMLVMIASDDLVTLFVGLELASIGLCKIQVEHSHF